MPFIPQPDRASPDLTKPGHRCFVWYKWMKTEWKKERRWTTVDSLYSQVCEFHKQRKLPVESLRAMDLAWQVFFVFEVIPYEEEMKYKNGDVFSKTGD